MSPKTFRVKVRKVFPVCCFVRRQTAVPFPACRASLWSSCVVLPLLALTWMSAVLAITDRRSALFQILFAVFDSLEGFVIVMVHCILRREVAHAHVHVRAAVHSMALLSAAAEVCSELGSFRPPAGHQMFSTAPLLMR